MRLVVLRQKLMTAATTVIATLAGLLAVLFVLGKCAPGSAMLTHSLI